MYSWNNAKNTLNQRKHGISFETAIQVFQDPLHITHPDRTVNGELRWHTVGVVDEESIILIVHTLNEAEDGEEYIRIISARRITKKEGKAAGLFAAAPTSQVLGHSTTPKGKGWFGLHGYRAHKESTRNKK